MVKLIKSRAILTISFRVAAGLDVRAYSVRGSAILACPQLLQNFDSDCRIVPQWEHDSTADLVVTGVLNVPVWIRFAASLELTARPAIETITAIRKI